MGVRGLALCILLLPAAMRAQTPSISPSPSPSPCPGAAVYSPCDIVFELENAETASHPNPYVSVDIHAEFRSPRHRTYLLPAFWDGGQKMIIRFAPTEPGDWDYRVSSNLQRIEGQTGRFSVAANDNPAFGFIRTANMHHFAYTDDNKNVPHLWAGATEERFGFVDSAEFERMMAERAEQKFNHIRGALFGSADDSRKIFPKPDTVDPAQLGRIDERILLLNRKGMVVDLILAMGPDTLTKLFPTWEDRQRFVRYIIGRYAAMNVTWQIVDAFEPYQNGRELMKEVGTLLKKLDPYQHPRSAGALVTSAPLLDDGWMDYILYATADDQVGAIEHQLYAAPGVNVGPPGDVDAATFRHRMWNAAMDGQYISFTNPAGGVAFMPAWRDFFAASRHWDLEPYFDVDGGRAVALEEVEYLVYVEKPQQIEVAVEKHGYDVAWFNPLNGEWVKQKKDFKGEKFLGEPPDRSHDWVLRLSREGHKESMLKSFRFEARTAVLQEVELDSQKVPFEIVEPGDNAKVSKPTPYSIKLKRETRATRAMMYLWTGDVASDGQGYRVLGTGVKGTLTVPAGIVNHFPAVMQLHVAGMNANGKVYSADKIIQVSQ